MPGWKKIIDEHPPTKRVIKTKISDKDGDRNEKELIFENGLWWFPDKSMYVYYTPTHFCDV